MRALLERRSACLSAADSPDSQRALEPAPAQEQVQEPAMEQA